MNPAEETTAPAAAGQPTTPATPGGEEPRAIPSTNEIGLYLNCKKCYDDIRTGRARGVSPKNYSALSVGWTTLGLQVWCERHGCNVAHIDFQGQKHPANLHAAKRERP